MSFEIFLSKSTKTKIWANTKRCEVGEPTTDKLFAGQKQSRENMYNLQTAKTGETT